MGADIMASPTNDRRTQLQLERDEIHSMCQLRRLCGVLTEASSPEPSYRKEHP